MQSISDKCHLLLNFKEKVAVNDNNFRTENSNHKKHLGVHFVNKLTFDHHLTDM